MVNYKKVQSNNFLNKNEVIQCSKSRYTSIKNKDVKILILANFERDNLRFAELTLIKLTNKYFWRAKIAIWKDFVGPTFHFKHEYLRSRAYKCLSLSSSSSDSYLSVKSLRFFCILSFIEIIVLISWIPASENFYLERYRISGKLVLNRKEI